ncbi:MAG: hypothetical protein BGO25_03655 [Acidobacteriales bacterium 59-55]|nr:ABC transporter permease [Terriglobales bacterium]OJV40254.1 MAG: hypothetical protein BGO25_03655 [Acidobacteriales bacterium 59-55]
MNWLKQLISRTRRYDELSESIGEHLEEKIADLMDGGMTKKQAEHRARREFGNITRIEELSREVWQWPRLESIWADVRYALRLLIKSPAITMVIVLTLALCIGAVTAVFSLAYGVLIDPFPYKNTDALATPKLCSPEVSHCYWDEYTPQQVLEIERGTNIFSSVTAYTVGNIMVTSTAEARQVRGAYITPNLFDVVDLQPMLGRASGEDDVQPGHGEVALISYRYWQAHFGGSPSVVGRTITVAGHPRIIIGILPPRFLWRGADLYLPIELASVNQTEGRHSFTLLGRMKPGVTEAQATAELQSVFQDFAAQDPHRYPKNLQLGLMRFKEMYQSGLTGTLYLLLGAVFVLMLIGCVNVSSLLLARAVKREHEFVLRSAVGASHLRLVRQAVTESLLLAVIALPVAIAFADVVLRAALRFVPRNAIPDEALVTLNMPVLVASLGIALLTVFLFGLLPAWHNAHPRLAAALNTVRSSGSRAQRHWLHGFVVAEIALALALLSLAGLMARSLIAMENVPTAFLPDQTLLMRIPLDAKRYPTPESKGQFFRELLEQVRRLPGVKAATVDTELPFLRGYGAHPQIGSLPVRREDYSNLHLVDPAYLSISGQRMLKGHFIDARALSEQSHDMVVTENFARRYFPDGDALGRSVRLSDFMPFDGKKLTNDTFTVVGVISDLPTYPGYARDYPHLFLPYTVAPVMDTVVIATDLPPDSLIGPVRAVVRHIDKEQPVIDAMSLRDLLNMYGYAGPRFALGLFGGFACAALLLCFIGIYGVLSFAISQRTQEIGIRMAMGASRASVTSMVLRQALGLALLGIAIGLPLALFAGHLAKNTLFHISPSDPTTFFAVSCILPMLALVGTWLPARRAAAVDPIQALRSE